MKNTTKKWIFVAGGLVISAVLVALIAAQFKPDIAIEPMPLPSSASEMPQSEGELVFVPNTRESIPTENGDASGSEQTIQPDASKPEPPSEPPKVENEDTLKDPASTPEYKPEDTEIKPTPKPDEPKAGDVKGGKTYIPGFGWVEGTGDTHGAVVGNHDDELTGNKVGIM